MRNGRIQIDTTQALSWTWGMSAREVGAEWLAYLRNEPSMFEDFCSYKEARPSARPHWGEWKHIRERILARDGYRCTYCGATDRPLECDHKMPVALGGKHTDDNLTTACQPCNTRKGMKTADEFVELLQA